MAAMGDFLEELKIEIWEVGRPRQHTTSLREVVMYDEDAVFYHGYVSIAGVENRCQNLGEEPK